MSPARALVLSSLLLSSLLLSSLLLVLIPAGGAAQDLRPRPAASAHAPTRSADPGRDGTRGSDLSWLGANALLGGLGSGLVRWYRGGSFLEGFAGGAFGGSLAYAGRRVAAGEGEWAGLLGRQVGGVGGSIARNAADTVPLLSRLTLAVGPLRVDVGPGSDEERPRLRVELFDVGALAWGLSRSEWTLDERLSVRSGALVFVNRSSGLGPGGRAGTTYGGAIFMRRIPEGGFRRSLRHERVHVLQLDFVHRAWLGPLEDAALARAPLPDGVRARIELDVLVHGLAGLGKLLGLDDELSDPLEQEAEFLEWR